MNFWHMQLHPDDTENFTKDDIKAYLGKGFVGMGASWKGDNGQPELFRNNVEHGDIVMIRHEGPFALVRIIGDVQDNEDSSMWFDICRPVEVLSLDGHGAKEAYEKEMKAKWLEGLFNASTFKTAKNNPFIVYWYSKEQERLMEQEIINLLTSAKNLVLTGAPGTGKTWLAAKVAAEMTGKNSDDISERIRFVQFHQSYDYTDFVEGLRPVKAAGHELGFELRPGIFKEFCSAARRAQKEANEGEGPAYVFIVDEINRAEISKVFGELFFSIDPGYRGPAGRVRTQYANLASDDDTAFGNPGDFYVPDNVYIIGTMNDIDRSVESFDFAMRRRFAWIEIDPRDRMQMLHQNEAIDAVTAEQAISRMESMNSIIRDERTLGPEYQIGPAYFLKIQDYPEAADRFQQLWTNNLLPLLKEYLRGNPDRQRILTALKTAFNTTEYAPESISEEE